MKTLDEMLSSKINSLGAKAQYFDSSYLFMELIDELKKGINKPYYFKFNWGEDVNIKFSNQDMTLFIDYVVRRLNDGYIKVKKPLFFNQDGFLNPSKKIKKVLGRRIFIGTYKGEPDDQILMINNLGGQSCISINNNEILTQEVISINYQDPDNSFIIDRVTSQDEIVMYLMKRYIVDFPRGEVNRSAKFDMISPQAQEYVNEITHEPDYLSKINELIELFNSFSPERVKRFTELPSDEELIQMIKSIKTGVKQLSERIQIISKINDFKQQFNQLIEKVNKKYESFTN